MEQVISQEEPSCWENRNEVLLSRHIHRSQAGWSLVWVPREQNKGADLAAKWARLNKCNFGLVDGFALNLSGDFLNCISLESIVSLPM